MKALVLTLALGLAACAREPEPRPNLLLISIDTLRPDHLSCYGYARPTSPALDALAASGLRFTHVESPRAKTTPAIASLLTGLYPHEHGVRDFGSPLAPAVPTLAESLLRAGYRTAGAVANYVLSERESGLARGFERWVEDFPVRRGVPPDEVPEQIAGGLTSTALGLLGLAPSPEPGLVGGERPWFLWLHYMDPHGRYEPPAEHELFHASEPRPIQDEPGASPELRVATYNVPEDAWLPQGEIDAARVIDRYDGEIHYVDAEIGRLLAALRAAGELERTWVVITADHGESLGEERYWFEHGAYAHEATCRVPLLAHAPLGATGRPAPGVRGQDLSLADLAPSLLELLGIAVPERARGGPRGRSRAELFGPDPGPDQHIVYCEKIDAELAREAVQTKAARRGPHKLVWRFLVDASAPQGMRLLSERLYDVDRDFAEEHDLSGLPALAETRDELRAALRESCTAEGDLGALQERLSRERAEREVRDPASERVLRAMGYR